MQVVQAYYSWPSKMAHHSPLDSDTADINFKDECPRKAQSSSASRRKLFIVSARKTPAASADETNSHDLSPRTISDSSANDAASPFLFRRRSFFSRRSSSMSELGRPSRSSGMEMDGESIQLLHTLENVLQQKEDRDEFVACLLTEHRLDLVLRVRFVSAINELMRSEDDSDKAWATKARQIKKIFLEPSSRFYLNESTVPLSLVSDIASAVSVSSLEASLSRARYHVAAGLVTDKVVRAQLQVVMDS